MGTHLTSPTHLHCIPNYLHTRTSRQPQAIRLRAHQSGVPDVRFLSHEETRALEPNVQCTKVRHTGTNIFDSGMFAHRSRHIQARADTRMRALFLTHIYSYTYTHSHTHTHRMAEYNTHNRRSSPHQLGSSTRTSSCSPSWGMQRWVDLCSTVAACVHVCV